MKVLSKLAAGRNAKSQQIRRPKGVGRIVTWVMWSRQNAVTAFMVTGFTLLLGVGYVLVRLIYGYQVAQYEADLAAQQRARTAATEPVIGADRYAPVHEPQNTGTPAPPLPDTPAEGSHPIPPGALPATPSATGTPRIATGNASLEAAPQAATRAFLKVWLAAPTYPSDRAWATALAPYSSPELAKLFEMTDRASVPQLTVVSLTSVTLGTTSHVTVKTSTRATVAVILERGADGRWRVVDVAPEEA
jgi:hypothetical protein